MPYSKTHEERKVKNYLLFSVVLALIVIFFAVTIVKIKNASELRDQPKQTPENNMVQAK
jgi:hypothetical protein